MIQRVQTLYLLAAGLISALTIFLPLAFFSTSTTSGELFDIYASGLKVIEGAEIQRFTYMFILSIGASILPIVSIFLFKNRMLQIRLCVVEVVLQLGLYAMIAIYYYLSRRVFVEVGIETQGFHPALFAPAVAIGLSLLAARSIFRDEILVRSVDRIR